MRRTLPFLLFALALAPAAHATTLGVYGDPGRFRSLTGQASRAKQVFPSWGSTSGRMDRAFSEQGPVPIVAIMPRSRTQAETITPRGIARGKGDGYLIRVSLAAHRYGSPSFVRPLPEMNGHWNPFCAYNKDGTRRNAAHSQAVFRNAFRRIYVIVHGGPRDEMNARLARLGMPPVRVGLPTNPQVTVIWNPQGFGSPNVPRNMPAAYWPGKAWVDMVGNDLYDMAGRATWEWADKLYRQYPGKPHAFPEWGLWGIDDPAFIRRMRSFVLHHPRVELLSWFNGKNGSIFDLGSKPASRRAYQRYITPLAG